MENPLQHHQAAQRIGLSFARATKHRSDRPEADDTLTIKPDHPMGARQKDQRRSFQLYRKNSHGGRIVTFDEVLERLKICWPTYRDAKPSKRPEKS